MSNKVLIVDDAAFMRMMIKEILSKNGYSVVGKQVTALKQLKNTKSSVLTWLPWTSRCLKWMGSLR